MSREIRDLIRKMSQANPLWGAPRIHGELLKHPASDRDLSAELSLIADRLEDDALRLQAHHAGWATP